MKPTKTIILAGGKGTRMHSELPKVCHEICGKPLVSHVIAANEAAGVSDIAVIVGYRAELVKAVLPESVRTYLQAEQLGTGHAVMQALPFIENFDGNVLVLMGDAPMIRAETLKGLIAAREAGNFGAVVLSAHFDDPTGYGRMVKDGDELIKIVEEKDASPEEKTIHEINSGMYCFDAKALVSVLSKITPQNAQGEYYLTDTIELLREAGLAVGTYPTDDPEDLAAVNNPEQLAECERLMKKRLDKQASS